MRIRLGLSDCQSSAISSKQCVYEWRDCRALRCYQERAKQRHRDHYRGEPKFLANAQEGPELDHETAHQIPLELSSPSYFGRAGRKARSLKDAQSISAASAAVHGRPTLTWRAKVLGQPANGRFIFVLLTGQSLGRP
jgi:hypothetical protein